MRPDSLRPNDDAHLSSWYVDQFGQEWYDKFTGAAAACETSVDQKLALWGSK